jgi:ABC-2 type transport system ATP-binding protein
MEPALDIDGLRKVFQVREHSEGLRAALRALITPKTRELVAVESVSFRIEHGERVAFVGPNGAGKSTTIKMLSGILHPSGGSARVLGLVPWQDRKQLCYRIGTVFGQRSQLFYHLPAADSFALLRHVYDQDAVQFERRRAALVDAFGVAPYLHKPVRQLSLGERMRCELIASLLHAPEILLLDEPTIGLDVSAKAAVRELVRNESLRYGRTLLLTSHDTADMERVCERVIMIHHGRVLLDQPVHSLRSLIKRKRLCIQTAEAAASLSMTGVRVVSSANHRLELEVDLCATEVEAVVQAILRATQVKDLTIEDPPLDEIVQSIYEGTAQPTSGDTFAVPIAAEAGP